MLFVPSLFSLSRGVRVMPRTSALMNSVMNMQGKVAFRYPASRTLAQGLVDRCKDHGYKLENLDLRSCLTIKGISLKHSTLNYSSFKGGSVRLADFSYASLVGVDFTDCDCTGCNFTGANLTGAKFERANITLANFHVANVSGADFTDATIGEGLQFISTRLMGSLGVWVQEARKAKG